jgi:hypothetical protein
MKLKTEEAQSTLHLARVEEHSKPNVSQQHAELMVAVVKTMQKICKIGNIKIEQMVICEICCSHGSKHEATIFWCLINRY